MLRFIRQISVLSGLLASRSTALDWLICTQCIFGIALPLYLDRRIDTISFPPSSTMTNCPPNKSPPLVPWKWLSMINDSSVMRNCLSFTRNTRGNPTTQNTQCDWISTDNTFVVSISAGEKSNSISTTIIFFDNGRLFANGFRWRCFYQSITSILLADR